MTGTCLHIGQMGGAPSQSCQLVPTHAAERFRAAAPTSKDQTRLLHKPRSEDHAFLCCRCELPASIPQPAASRLRRPPQRSRAARVHLVCRAPPRCGGALAKTPWTHVPSHDWPRVHAYQVRPCTTFLLPLHGRWSLGWLVCILCMLRSARTLLKFNQKF